MFSRKTLYPAVLGVVALTIAAAPATAGKGNASATITFAGSGLAPTTGLHVGDSVAFNVTANVKPSDTGKLWVTTYCTQNGVTVYAASQGAALGSTAPFTLTWSGGSAQ